MPAPPRRPETRYKDGRPWRIGTDDEVAWINDGVTGGPWITAGIPPVFRAYATLAFPVELEADGDDMRPPDDLWDDALLCVLSAHTEPQPWWLGFLDTGASDVVFDDAPRAQLYSWRYVLVRAGPQEARTWRTGPRWFTALPELFFPEDRSWLVSSLWDDAWAGVGGPPGLISALVDEPRLRTGAERTDPSVSDMWPTSLPDEMHERLQR